MIKLIIKKIGYKENKNRKMGIDTEGFSLKRVSCMLKEIDKTEKESEKRILKVTSLLCYYDTYLEDIFKMSKKSFDAIKNKARDFFEYRDSTDRYKQDLVKICDEIIAHHESICEKYNYTFGNNDNDTEIFVETNESESEEEDTRDTEEDNLVSRLRERFRSEIASSSDDSDSD